MRCDILLLIKELILIDMNKDINISFSMERYKELMEEYNADYQKSVDDFNTQLKHYWIGQFQTNCTLKGVYSIRVFDREDMNLLIEIWNETAIEVQKVVDKSRDEASRNLAEKMEAMKTNFNIVLPGVKTYESRYGMGASAALELEQTKALLANKLPF